jgi:hypothetical protein
LIYRWVGKRSGRFLGRGRHGQKGADNEDSAYGQTRERSEYSFHSTAFFSFFFGDRFNINPFILSGKLFLTALSAHLLSKIELGQSRIPPCHRVGEMVTWKQVRKWKKKKMEQEEKWR